MKANIEDLRNEISTLQNNYPSLTEDNIFVLWFLRAFLTEDLEEAAKSVTGEKTTKILMDYI